MRPLHLILPALFLAAAPLANGCTETPDDLPECVGPNSYCPSDGGTDAPDALTTIGTAAAPEGGPDAMVASDAANVTPDAATVSVDAATED